MSHLAGFFGPAVAGVLIATVLATSATAQEAAPLPNGRTGVDRPPVVSLVEHHVPMEEAIRLDRYLERLDEWRVEGRINTVELARARRLLYAAIVQKDTSIALPYEADGHIDLLRLARSGTANNNSGTMTRGERAFEEMTREIETRMRVTARDMSDPSNVVFIDGAPGYKEIPARDVERIILRALEDVPLNELPGGLAIARLAETLPNTGTLNADKMSLRELKNDLGDRERVWLNERAGPLIKGHEIEAGLIAFGAITGLRASSPEAARFMDRLGVKIRVFRESTADGRLYATGTLAYRDAHILPEIDLEGGARHVVGNTTFRATVTTTVGAEADDVFRGRTTIGARWARDNLYVDSSATYFFPEDRLRAELRAGYLSDAGLSLSGAVAANFGTNSGSLGSANGRLSYEVDLTTPVKIGDANGEFGLYLGGGADTDLRNDDVRAGLVFRLRW